MLARYAVVMLIVGIASVIAVTIFRDNLILMIFSVVAIWLTPMYLANRALYRTSD